MTYRNLKHRNLCKIVDIEYDTKGNEKQMFVMNENYNASLLDLYRTYKSENIDF